MTCLKDLNQDRLHGFYWLSRLLYIMVVFMLLVLDALNFTGTDVALYQVTRESFGHPSNDGNRYVFIASPVTGTL